MFEASLLAFVVGRWSPSLRSAVPLGLLAAATPVLVALVQDPAEVAIANWITGIVFPWAISRAFVRQDRLADQLEDTQRQLARQALVADRRGIARDVHDFVGHGLAAVMLQVTSARHVLRRDPAAAEEALRSVEEVGRRSMHELRRTVALLRSDDETGVDQPLPSVAEIPHSSIRRVREVWPSSCRCAATSRRSLPASESRSTGSPRRRWRTRRATRHGRGHHSRWS